MDGDEDLAQVRSPEDRAILEIGQELSAGLGTSQFKPQRVAWVEKYRKRVLVLPDQPAFQGETLFVSDKIRGKLTPEDWKALLAASIAYDNTMRLRRRIGRLTILLGCALVFFGANQLSIVILSLMYPLGPPMYATRGLGVPFVAVLLGGLLLVAAITAPYMRRLRFLADEMVAQKLGLGEALLIVLRKVESLALGQNPAQNRRFAHKPSVADRIAKLSTKSFA